MEKKHRLHHPMPRREFLKQTATGVLGLSAGAGFVVDSLAADFPLPMIKSSVVVVRHSKVIGADGAVERPLVLEMIERAITALSGEGTIGNAWRTYFSPEDIIGLKVNCGGLWNFRNDNVLSHFLDFSSAIIASCKKAGFDDKNFVIWDQTNDDLKSAGYVINYDDGKIRVLGNIAGRHDDGRVGYDSKKYWVGNKKSSVTRILSDICTAMINIPLIKGHDLCGMSGSMKNHYGTISNPDDFHNDHCCNPGIPEINAIPIIRQKQKLIIADALFGIFDDGPRWRMDTMWTPRTIIVGTDPVAVDSVLLTILDKKRIAVGLKPASMFVKHLVLSEKLGLGTQNPDYISLTEINLE